MPLSIKKLYKTYNTLKVFENFNIEFHDNVINCILGESGCGKTTLLNIIAGLAAADSGEITGTEHNSFSYIFQEPRLLPWYTVRENMEYVLNNTDIDNKNIRIDKYLSITGLKKFEDFYPPQLSGGMQQRLSIARAFAYPGDILLMDEPFKGLDIRLKKELTDEFIRLWESDNRTVLFVTHELDEVMMMADYIYVIGGNPLKEIYKANIDMSRDKRQRDSTKIVKEREILYSVFNDRD